MSGSEVRPNRSRSAHRPEIHGLRGFAIALVVIYHIWGAGRVFGGVDVFLMISAYLLTGSLLRRGRSFSCLDHLLRRFRRLVPSAALVIVVTLLGGWLLLPPTRRWDLLAEASLFYLQNWFLIAVATDYTPATTPWRALISTSGRCRCRDRCSCSDRCCWGSRWSCNGWSGRCGWRSLSCSGWCSWLPVGTR
ncbi:acyltransferase [Naumannella sp. ID2617S]|nr:acyltransferase [Naumannella sp. ID2617S]